MRNTQSGTIIEFPKKRTRHTFFRVCSLHHILPAHKSVASRVFQKHFVRESIIIAVFILFLGGILCIPASNAHAKDHYRTEKRIASVKIQENDSLWSIASAYYTKECGSMRSYITEIKRTNGLSGDVIYAESYLIIPYYVSIPLD